MNTKTGKIEMLDALEAAAYKSNLTPLSPKEYEAMLGHSEEDRPVELALMRFIEERKKLGASVTVAVKNAFRLGYKAAISDREEQ